MSLASGTRLGPYEIQSAIGAGGMGEVYKARDTRLDRTVAIKVLPPDVSADPERRARFEREAKTIAGLNHAHICTLHDVGDHDGALFLVMEHLAGQTLAERLEKGPLPLEQALTVATEIADALSAAHRQGIIHRDLKPANVMLTKSGAKLLDFGLAKLTGHGDQPAAAYAASAVPTQAATLTGQGVIVGTLQYMAPEQLEGKPPDARTDLWALGAVMYEMVTGRRAFGGTSAVSLMAAILEHEPPPVASLRPLTPPALGRLVRKCLAKIPDDRWDSAHDVADELRWILVVGATGTAGESSGANRFGHRVTALAAAFFVVGAVLVGVTSFLWRGRQPPPRVERYELNVAPAEGLRGADPSELNVYAGRPSRLALAVSPDGRWLAYAANKGTRQGLYLRDLSRGEAALIPNTDEGEGPFFSPDGRRIGFWADGSIRTVELAGGSPATVCESSRLFGASWGADGRIVFARRDGPLWSVAESGGTPSPLTSLRQGETSHHLPMVLAGGRKLLYSVLPSPSRIVVEDVRSHERVEIAKGDTARGDPLDARYVATGHVVFGRRGSLEGVAVDPERFVPVAAPVVLIREVMQSVGGESGLLDTGAVQMAVSPTGALFYVSGGRVPAPRTTLTWRDMAGHREPILTTTDQAEAVRLSPDGTRVAVSTLRGDAGAVVSVFRVGVPILTQVTPPGVLAYSATWVPPDGHRLAFGLGNEGALFTMPAVGSAAPERLTTSAHPQTPQCWTRDGRTLVYVEGSETTRDLYQIEMGPNGKRVTPLLRTDDQEEAADLSPDGRWLAYQTGRQGLSGAASSAPTIVVYVRGFGTSSGAVRISPENGFTPIWSPDGRTLYYTRSEARGPGWKTMIAVDMQHGQPVPGKPQRELFSDRWFVTYPFRNYDLSPDGKRFLFIEEDPLPIETVSRVHVVLNWLEELKAKVPPAR